MEDKEDIETGDARGEAFLREGAPVDAGAPPWLDALVQARLVVAVVEPASGDLGELARTCREQEILADGRWIVARPVNSNADLRAFVGAVRAQTAGGRGAVAVGPGLSGANTVLGPVPASAVALFATLEASGRRGVLVDAGVLAACPQPAATQGDGFLLLPRTGGTRRRAIAGVVALAAAVVLGLGVAQLMGPKAPDGHIYIFGERAGVERGGDPAAPGTTLWRPNDAVTVAIDGPPGAFVSLVLLDSKNRWVVPQAAARDVQLTAEKHRVTARFEFDDQPGLERFVGVISAAALPDLDATLQRLNQAPGVDRDARIRALREALGDTVRVAPAADLEHVP